MDGNVVLAGTENGLMYRTLEGESLWQAAERGVPRETVFKLTKYDGRIWVESRSGIGTAVSFTLPLETDPVAASSKRWLSPKHEYTVRSRPSMAPTVQPKPLVVVDEHIVGMSGAEFLEKTLDKHSDIIRILIATNVDDESFTDKNIHKYISKPWEPGEIMSAVREGIEAYEFSRLSKEPYIWALLHSEIISRDQLTVALQIQKDGQKTVEDILLKQGIISKEQLDMATSRMVLAAKSRKAERKSLDETLIELDAISHDDLEIARDIQRRQKKTLPEVLSELDYASEEEVFSCYALQLGMPYISLSQLSTRLAAVEAVPQELAYKHTLVPIDSMGQVLVVAASGPLDEAARDELEAETGRRVMTVCASHQDVETALEECYAGAGARE